MGFSSLKIPGPTLFLLFIIYLPNNHPPPHTPVAMPDFIFRDLNIGFDERAR